MRISDWSSDVCSSDLHGRFWWELRACAYYEAFEKPKISYQEIQFFPQYALDVEGQLGNNKTFLIANADSGLLAVLNSPLMWWFNWRRSEEHTSEIQSLMRNSYAVFCLKKTHTRQHQ